MREGVVAVKLMGGMGNQMFQYALGRAISIRNNIDYCVDIDFYNEESCHREYYLGMFQLSVLTCKESDCINTFKVIKDQWNFNKNILKIDHNIYLDGYWQSSKYFDIIEQELRKDFIFKDELRGNANILSQKILSSNSVCLNIRLTDYVGHPILGVCDRDYYLRAIKRMREELINPVFYVFSDVIEWCEKNFKEHKNFIFVSHSFAHSNGKSGFDEYFQLMTLCKNYIIPNSTFAWWAVWLNENKKNVIAPKRWFVPDHMNSDGLYCEDWILL